MCDVSTIPGLADLWAQTKGESEIRVAMVDGPADLGHPAFRGADIRRLDGVWPEEGLDGQTARHGTHVASVLFGQHGGQVRGISPGCCGLALPAFSGQRRKAPQLEVARALELAVEAGAHVINVSGGQLSLSGEAADLLERAVRLCRERNVLVVAAAGNDGCFCAHVPAALPSALAVGALDDSGEPLAMSNWGPAYADQGILAPGENILGAIPGGAATATASGTSMATPIVAGVAALLLSLQVKAGHRPDPLGVRAILLSTAQPCPLRDSDACKRYLTGKLDIRRAMSAVRSSSGEAMDAAVDAVVQSCERGRSQAEETVAPSCECSGRRAEKAGAVAVPSAEAGRLVTTAVPSVLIASPAVPAVATGAESALSQRPAGPPHMTVQPYVYALGALGYDFGTEARRDSFKQLMAPITVEGTVVPSHPYDARQMADHLAAHPCEAKALIWTLNLELTPIYAIEPTGPYAASVYELLAQLLAGEAAAEDSADYIERVSIPGRLTGRTTRLFSGQVIPIIEIEQIRGLFGWRVNTLIAAATQAAAGQNGARADADLSDSLREFLTRVYYDLRNLGATSRDRALNFAATNAFQAAHTFAAAVAAGLALDTIDVAKSPFCRTDSDCWDVKLRFFDPENSRRARKVFRFTIDVSDILPVTLGVVRTWSEAG